MTLVVFGGSGFVGSAIISKLRNKERIVSFSSSKIEIIKSNSISKVKYNNVINYLKNEKKFDAIFCASTRYDPKKYINNSLDIFLNNISAFVKFMKILQNSKLGKVILISSYAVYGNNIKNNNEMSKISVNKFSKKEFFYAQAKYLQENIFLNFCKEKSIKYNIIRLPSIYGPGSTLNLKNAHVVPSFIIQILKNKKSMKIYGNGSEKREFIFIFDLIKIILKLRKKNISGIINIGSNKFITIKDLLNKIINLTNSKIHTEYNNKSISDVPLRKVNYHKFKRNFKRFEFEEITNGLKKTIEWYKKIND